MPSRVVSIPAPVGGWNTRDSLDAMEPTDAVTLDNWFPGLGKVTVRKGYASHCTGVGSGDVETLAEYHVGSTRKLIAAGGTAIYDATSSTASSIGTGFSNARWQVVSFNGRLFMVNGADAPRDYNGTTLAATSWSGSGLTIANLIGVNAFKNRLFFWENNSQDFWYAAIDSVSGTLTKFPLSRVGHFGGNLMAMGTWTLDGGNGVDDVAVFVMTSGEVIVYAGTDPGDATAWALQGVYRIAQPIDRRAIIKFGGDIAIATVEDYYSLSQVLDGSREPTKISGAVPSAHASGSSYFGWQTIYHPKGNMVLVNIPTSANTYHQHVLNTITGAWCRFKDIPSRCWSVYNTDLYFGGAGGVVYRYTGTKDVTAEINADGSQAWSRMGTPYRKRVSAIRSVIQSEGTVSYSVGVGFDFQDTISAQPSTSEAGGSAWDTSPWDTSAWSAENVIQNKWRASRGSGQSIATRLRVSAKQSISWLRTDYRIEVGQNL